MIRAGFLSTAERAELIELARNGLVEHRVARRANALVLLDHGMSCSAIGAVLLLDDDTIRTWFRLHGEEGIEGLAGFGYEGSACHLSAEQRERLKSWIAETLPRTTRHVGAWIEQEFSIAYQSRSGLVALLHRLGMEHRKPRAVSQKLDVDKQKAFIEAYQHYYDKDLYKERNQIERFFGKLKEFRRIATRYDKLLQNFLGFVKIAALHHAHHRENQISLITDVQPAILLSWL